METRESSLHDHQGPPINKSSVDGYGPEDRRKHLEFIQAIIARMSAASASAKGWLLPVVTAAYGYALTKHSPSVAILGIVASVMFAFIDAHYLDEERKYRRLYNAVASGKQQIPPFSLDPSQVDQPHAADLTSGWVRRFLKWAWKAVKKAACHVVPRCVRRRVESWMPEKTVWCSWSIFPFYMGIIAGGVIVLLRV